MTSSKLPILEVCIASVDDALTARNAGANRLELNAAMALGGLTPSLGLLRMVKQAVALPVVTMIRPRPGGFCYSAAEFEVMRLDIELALQNGSDAIAFGILTENGEIDVARCRTLLEAIGERPAVFHRAFDLVCNPRTALEQLIKLGFTRILTSGQEEMALSGVSLISQLIQQAGGRIKIVPAVGVNRSNVSALVAATGCREVHGSFRRKKTDHSTYTRPSIQFGTRGAESSDDAADFEEIAAVRHLLDQQSSK
jgi:copper homeostasis protein